MADDEFYEGLTIDDLKVMCDEKQIKYSRTASELTLIKFLKRAETERERNLEMEREREERIEKEKMQIEKEIRIREVELRAEVNGLGNNPVQPVRTPEISKLVPNFCEDKNSIDVYLDHFEKTLTIHGVDKNLWVRGLSSVISGKALETFSSLSLETLKNYDSVKAALLERYQIGAEQFRKNFREIRKGEKESYSELGHKLRNLFDKWISCKQATGDPAAITELILIEQFYMVLPEGLKIWLRDRNPQSLKECCKLADEHSVNREFVNKNKQWGKTTEGFPSFNAKGNQSTFKEKPSTRPVTVPSGAENSKGSGNFKSFAGLA